MSSREILEKFYEDYDRNITIEDIPIDTIVTLTETKHDGYQTIMNILGIEKNNQIKCAPYSLSSHLGWVVRGFVLIIFIIRTIMAIVCSLAICRHTYYNILQMKKGRECIERMPI